MNRFLGPSMRRAFTAAQASSHHLRSVLMLVSSLSLNALASDAQLSTFLSELERPHKPPSRQTVTELLLELSVSVRGESKTTIAKLREQFMGFRFFTWWRTCGQSGTGQGGLGRLLSASFAQTMWRRTSCSWASSRLSASTRTSSSRSGLCADMRTSASSRRTSAPQPRILVRTSGRRCWRRTFTGCPAPRTP